MTPVTFSNSPTAENSHTTSGIDYSLFELKLCQCIYIERDGFSSTYFREFSFCDSSCDHLDLTITGVFVLGGLSGILLKKNFQFWNITCPFYIQRPYSCLDAFFKQLKGSSLNLDVRVVFFFCLLVHIYLHLGLHVHFQKQAAGTREKMYFLLSVMLSCNSIQHCLCISPAMGRACCVSPSTKVTIFINGIAHMYFSDTW